MKNVRHVCLDYNARYNLPSKTYLLTSQLEYLKLANYARCYGAAVIDLGEQSVVEWIDVIDELERNMENAQ